MENLIRYLYNESGQQNCYIRHLNTLVFVFNNFELSIEYSLLNEVKGDDFDRFEDINDLINDILQVNLNKFYISISESFFDREDYNVKEQIIYIHQEVNSISNSMFYLVKQLIKLNKHLVLNYKLKVEDPNDEGMCGYYPQYIGEVEVDIKKINVEILDTIIKKLKSFTLIKLDNKYIPEYFNFKSPRNSFSPQFLNTNTKVRRLGYLKLFFKFITERKKIPQSFIDKKFEEYSLQFSSQLSFLSNNKGVIQNLGGKSAEPYISLLKSMDLITIVNRVVVPTKWLKSFLVLRENFIDENSEVFVLDKLDKLFLLEIILKKDFLYTIVILEFLSVNESCTTNEIMINFQNLLLKRIECLLHQAIYNDDKAISQLKEIEKRVMSWKKAEVYLEHIIMPRVNWYADLDILILNDNIVTINENGKRLINELNSWIDIKAEYVADSTDYLKKFYPYVHAKSYFESVEEYPKEEVILELVDEYINQSFTLFKTLSPNRVTSSQVFTFTKYCFYIKNGISVSESYLTRLLEEKLFNKYIYKFQTRYGDGYIQKII